MMSTRTKKYLIDCIRRLRTELLGWKLGCCEDPKGCKLCVEASTLLNETAFVNRGSGTELERMLNDERWPPIK